MKIINLNISLLLFLSTCLSLTAQAQTANKEHRMVQQTVENMFRALNAADTSTLKKLTTNSVHFYEYGEAWDYKKIESLALKSKTTPDFKRIDSFDFVSTNIKGNTAWVTYYLQSTITRHGHEDTYHWMETVILVKEKRSWKLDVLHSTRLDKK